MYNNKINTSFPPIMGGGGNYNLEYSNGPDVILPFSGLCCAWGTSGGCGSNCGGSCWTNCASQCGNCSDGCMQGCTSCTGCSGGCINSCTNTCSGCQGCSGCGGCDTGCSTTCKNTCTGLCTGSGAKVSINNTIKAARFYIGISNVVKQSSTQYTGINGEIKQI